MSRIRIKSLDERVATNGLHMGGGPERRKLQPFEVVDIPDDMLLPDGRALLDVLFETGKIELTLEDATRPLDYASYREGRLCSPTFKPRNPSDRAEAEQAQQAVVMRLSQSAQVETPAAVETDAPAEATPPKPKAARTAASRRAARRQNIKAADDGETLTA